MIKTAFFLRTAFNNLRRGGQRVWVALLCIAFGVMSLVAMTLFSQSIDKALILSPDEWMGADASLGRQADETIQPAQVSQLQALKEQGAFQEFTLVSVASDLLFRTPNSSDFHPVSNGLAIDPAVYPVAGHFTISQPGNTGAASLLQAVGDSLVTRDLAEKYGLKLGDPIVLTTLSTGAPVAGRVRGIVADTPNHQGSKIYYTLATADTLAGGKNAANTVLVKAKDMAPIAPTLDATGWTVFTGQGLTESNNQAHSLFDLLLKGAGILGLLVGGIGIANTMQVLLSRRREEAAVWRTLGYTAMDLHLLFTLEASLLGVLGSLLGALLGVGVSYQLVSIFSRTGNLLIGLDVAPSAWVVAGSMLAGVLTTVIFALWATVSASQVSPVSLLRGHFGGSPRQTFWQKALLSMGLALPFWGMSSLILKSALQGLGLLGFALAGLLVVGGILIGLAWGFSRLLPLRLAPILRLVQTSLGRNSRSLVFAMIALFAGVVTLALGVVIAQNAEQVVARVSPGDTGHHLAIIAPASQEMVVRTALTAQGFREAAMGYQTPVRLIRVAGQSDHTLTPMISAREADPYDYAVKGAPWGSVADGVYVNRTLNLADGTKIEVTMLDGAMHTFTVAGLYDEADTTALPITGGLLMPLEQSRQLETPKTLRVYVRTDGSSARMANALGQRLPGATVLDLDAYAARYMNTYHNLFILALAMSSLALLAGILLVANSASLAMLERRYEFGVLKATGYSHAAVLAMLSVEYGGVALASTAAGLGAVSIFLWVMSLVNPLAGKVLVMSLPATLAIGVGCVALIVATVLGVAWQTTRVSPIVILADRG